VTIDNINGTITRIVGLLIEGKTSSSGTFVQINFTAKNIDGTSSINLSNVVVGDKNAEALPITINYGQVTIRTYPDLDVNMDGKINILDLINIIQHWMATGPPGWIREDTNMDGSINLLDMILLAQHWNP